MHSVSRSDRCSICDDDPPDECGLGNQLGELGEFLSETFIFSFVRLFDPLSLLLMLTIMTVAAFAFCRRRRRVVIVQTGCHGGYSGDDGPKGARVPIVQAEAVMSRSSVLKGPPVIAQARKL